MTGIIDSIKDTVEKTEEKVDDVKKKAASWQSQGPLGKLYQMSDAIANIVEPFTKVQNAAIELSKSLGLSTKSIMDTTQRTIELNRERQLSMVYNVSTEEILGLRKNLASVIGRNVAFDEAGSTFKNVNGNIVKEITPDESELDYLLAARNVVGEERVGQMVAGFDKIGKNMKSAAKMFGQMAQEAGEYGINFQAYSDNLIKNLDLAQTYNFKNGVDGLKEMARKATELRQDMQQVTRLADKVGTVTGAIETASQLQVLGGSFAALANPLAMLNESLVNPEALQDRLLEMTRNSAQYDPTTHQIRMDAFSRLQIRRAAEAMGVDPNNLITQAFAQARQGEIQSQMDRFVGLSDNVQKMLKNVGQIDDKTGVAGATIDGEFRSIGEIAESQDLQDKLIEENRPYTDDIRDISKNVQGIYQRLGGAKSQMENEAARNITREGVYNGKSSYQLIWDFLNNNFTPEAIFGAANISQIEQNISTLFNTFVNTLSTSFNQAFNNVNSPEDFGKNWVNSLEKILGPDNELTKTLSPLADKFGTEAGKLAESINGFTQKYGVDFLSGFKDSSIIQIPNGTEAPIIINMGGNRAAVENTGTGTATTPGTTTSVSREIPPAISVSYGATDYGPISNSLTEIEQTVNQILKSTEESQGVKFIFVANPETMQGSTVAPQTTQTYTTYSPEQGGGTSTINHIITFDGKIIAEGKEINIEKILEKHPQILQSISKQISEVIATELANRS